MQLKKFYERMMDTAFLLDPNINPEFNPQRYYAGLVLEAMARAMESGISAQEFVTTLQKEQVAAFKAAAQVDEEKNNRTE